MAKPRQPAERAVRAPHAKERASFDKLLLENPNYFGNFPESGLEAVLPLSGNTAYEELTCVGYNPDRDELEATVQIKLPTGYGGNLCSAGSTEYVRFFVDYGSGFQDAGLASFNAHDIPNSIDCAEKPTKPLTYVVTFPHDPKRAFGQVVSRTSARHLYWSVEQQIAHATSNGARLRTGDLLASGTISGPTRDSCGSLIELSWNGAEPLALGDGSARTFLEDGDEVVLGGRTPDGVLELGAVAGRIMSE